MSELLRTCCVIAIDFWLNKHFGRKKKIYLSGYTMLWKILIVGVCITVLHDEI